MVRVLGCEDISKSQVFRIPGLDEAVEKFLYRSAGHRLLWVSVA